MQKEIAINEISHYSFGGIKYDPNRSQIEIKSKSKRISGYPRKILDILLENYPRSMSKDDLIAQVWTDDDGNIEKFNTHLNTLRIKFLEDKRSTDEQQKTKQIQWEIIDSVSMGYLAIKPKVTTHYFNDTSPSFCDNNRARFSLVSSITGITIGMLLMSTFLFAFKPVLHEPQNQKLLSELKGEFKRATMCYGKGIIAYTYKSAGSTSWNLLASKLQTGTINWLVNEEKTNTYNTEPNFSPSCEQIVWVHTDYKNFCDVFVANFDTNSLTINSKKSVLKCGPSQLVRTPHFKTESSLLVSISDFQTPYKVVELDLWTGKQKTITQTNESNSGDYSLFYNPNNHQMAYIRQSTGTGTELRLYDFNNQADTLIKHYPFWLYSVAWLNDQQLVVQSKDGYSVLSTMEANYSVPIEFNHADPLHYPFTIGNNTVGFIKGRLIDSDIIITNLKDQSINNRLSTRYNDYRSVIAKDKNSIAYFSLKDQKHQLFYATGDTNRPIAEVDFNATILDFAISPNGSTIAYQIGNQLVVRNKNGKRLYTDNIKMKGFTFSADSQHLLIAKSNDNDEPSIVSLSINKQSQSDTIATGFMPKISQAKLYYLRKDLTDDKTWLFQHTKSGENRLLPLPFSTTRLSSNSFDIVNNHLYYIENGHVVKMGLDTKLKTTIAKVGGRSFSINNAEDTLVSTIKSPIQNNIISLELPR